MPIEELRLLLALALNAAALFAAWRIARWRRRPELSPAPVPRPAPPGAPKPKSAASRPDSAAVAADTLLGWLLIQSIAVMAPGFAGILSAATIAVCALILSAAAVYFTRRPASASAPPTIQPATLPPSATAIAPAPVDRWTFRICITILAATLAAFIWQTFDQPPQSIDSLIYHFTAAAQWLQRGRIGVFDQWYQPANAYSPLGGSVFAAWWMAPVSCDVFARFLQMPALALVFLELMLLIEALGARRAVAALVALAAVLCRPFISESILGMDDLFLAAFFIAAARTVAPGESARPLAALRFGAALGLALSIKYTAWLSIPALALLIDAPPRPRWRFWAAAFAMTALLAGPWHLRNLLLTGNPLFPIEIKAGGAVLLRGLFETAPAPDLRSLDGLRAVFLQRFHSFNLPSLLALLAGYAAALFVAPRRILREPLLRLCIFGPAVAIGLFLLLAPYPEIRFTFPALLLMFAAAGAALARLGRFPAIAIALAGLLALACASSALTPRQFELVAPSFAIAALVFASTWRISVLLARSPRGRVYGPAVAAILLAMLIYTQWAGYLRKLPQSYLEYWRSGQQYPFLAQAWTFLEDPDKARPGAVAYNNIFITYPMMGFGYERPIAFAPTRRGVTDIGLFPHLAGKLNNAALEPAIRNAINADADAATFVHGIRASNAAYLLIGKDSERGGVSDNPPALAIARSLPSIFHPMVENEGVVLFEVAPE